MATVIARYGMGIANHEFEDEGARFEVHEEIQEACSEGQDRLSVAREMLRQARRETRTSGSVEALRQDIPRLP